MPAQNDWFDRHGLNEFVDAATLSEKTVPAKAMKPETSTSNSPSVGQATPAPGQPTHFSDEIERLITAFAEREVRLREVLEVTHSRGYTFLLIVMSFPFCTPIPLPGFSMPFGLAVSVIGLRLALGQKPWLPARLLDLKLPVKFFPQLLGATRRLVRWLEFLLKPRLGHLVRWRPVRQGMGGMILVCGLLLMIPLPIPFSNGLPAMTVLLLASAMLEEDGYFAVAGGVAFLLTLAFFAAIFWGGAEVAGWLQDRVGVIFNRSADTDL